ncbi:MAG: peptidoglycan-associated lipoprotein Pal, partial [Pseudomonadota bacterium]
MQNTTSRSVLRLTALAAATAASLWMAGCSTTSNKAETTGPAPITEAKPANTGANASGANNGGVPSTTVKPVDLSAGNGANGGANGGAAGADAAGNTVYFDFDKSAIRDDSRATIEANAKRLSAKAGQKVVIEGHTDERGGRE